MDNIINFAKARDLAMFDAFDLDAWLAKWRLDRVSVEAVFASLKVDEHNVPDLTEYRATLEELRETRAKLESPAEIDYSFKMERVASTMIILAKAQYVIDAALADLEDEGKTGKPKGKRPRH
jgi:hypothetical protein